MKQSKIESRVKAILDPSARRRRGVTLLEAIATVTVAAIAVIPFAALRAGFTHDVLPAAKTPKLPDIDALQASGKQKKSTSATEPKVVVSPSVKKTPMTDSSASQIDTLAELAFKDIENGTHAKSTSDDKVAQQDDSKKGQKDSVRSLQMADAEKAKQIAERLSEAFGNRMNHDVDSARAKELAERLSKLFRDHQYPALETTTSKELAERLSKLFADEKHQKATSDQLFDQISNSQLRATDSRQEAIDKYLAEMTAKDSSATKLFTQGKDQSGINQEFLKSLQQSDKTAIEKLYSKNLALENSKLMKDQLRIWKGTDWSARDKVLTKYWKNLVAIDKTHWGVKQESQNDAIKKLRAETAYMRAELQQLRAQLAESKARLDQKRTLSVDQKLKASAAQEEMMRQATAQLEMARAQAQAANAQMERQRALYRQGSIGNAELEKAEIALLTAEAQLRLAQEILKSHRKN